jgi:murein DD-endopeptidase / murein LD-carboxypeptidase
MAEDYAAAARALVGVRFRLQGRSDNGMDCVGVVLAAYGLTAASVRRDYSMRGDHAAEIRSTLERDFRRISRGQSRPGDLLHLLVAPDRHHFGIKTAAGFVHAHGGLGKVVETPGVPEWPLLAVFRRRSRASR